ncbi:DUF3604 domain-containing protein [Maricurvus nonylphenolicus]|uniref:DUF3604 domain-containing protein n=1 Tax=Maricurvus nonylphenolicus TaxID=1008307 RepID=UPI0036F3B086
MKKAVDSKVTRLTSEAQRQLLSEVAAENEDAITKPAFRARTVQQKNPLKNVYFGDTHVHTSWSFDSYLSGNRKGPEEAYRFAQGEPMTLFSGEVAQLTEPLDFVAIADHAESFGLFEGCTDKDLTPKQKDFCQQFDNPSLSLLFDLKRDTLARPPKAPIDLCGEDGEFCRKHGKTTWSKMQQAADAAYEPGVFTTIYAYEYSPLWPDMGSTHRNVLFRNHIVPDHVVSAFDAPTALDLWRTLENTCAGECEFLTIPHNLNRYQGKAYSYEDEDGGPYTEADWQRRSQSEPLAEIFQAKGNSECAIGLNTNDEECGFEQFYPLCEGENRGKCASDGSFARDGLKFGLQLEQQLDFNPLRFGFIGSTDTHNSTPGDTEAWDYRGKIGLRDLTAKKRLGKQKLQPGTHFSYNPGGLAAVWAEENTREAIFDAMKNKETYATSGTRIRLRFFAGWDYSPALSQQEDMIEQAYAGGVPMGGILQQETTSTQPKFLIWAAKDPNGAKLDRIQMIKSWVENGENKEAVFDIACSNNQSPDPKTGLCPDNGARVNLDTCEVSATSGNEEIKVVWQDPNFNSDHSAFYYVRALQNPTCRWSSYDAIRLGTKTAENISVIKERAWSSPIWYSPQPIKTNQPNKL